MLQDLRYAARGLLRTPGFTLVAVLTLALGIGATSAMFTVVNRVVLDPLPFPQADRLVLLWGSKPHEGQIELPFSQPDFEDLRSESRSYDSLAAWALGRGNVTGATEAEQVQYAVVTGNFLDVLGVRPALGRTLTAAEERPGTPPVALISHGLWQRRFSGAPDAIGATLRLDGRAVQVVGVLPAGFAFLTFPAATDLWLPLGADPFDGRRFARGARSMGVLGRVKAGVTLGQARAEADAIAAGLSVKYPRFNTGRLFRLVPLRDQVIRGVKDAALVLLAAVSLVLLIACANVASLQLARATTRQRELTIRAALGASRRRLIGHQLAESAVLATVGGAAGILLSVWLVDLLVTIPYRTDSLFVPYRAEKRDRSRHHRPGVHGRPHARDGVRVRPRSGVDGVPSARHRRPPRRRPRHAGPAAAEGARRDGRGRGRPRPGAARHRGPHRSQFPSSAARRSGFQPIRSVVTADDAVARGIRRSPSRRAVLRRGARLARGAAGRRRSGRGRIPAALGPGRKHRVLHRRPCGSRARRRAADPLPQRQRRLFPGDAHCARGRTPLLGPGRCRRPARRDRQRDHGEAGTGPERVRSAAGWRWTSRP